MGVAGERCIARETTSTRSRSLNWGEVAVKARGGVASPAPQGLALTDEEPHVVWQEKGWSGLHLLSQSYRNGSCPNRSRALNAYWRRARDGCPWKSDT